MAGQVRTRDGRRALALEPIHVVYRSSIARAWRRARNLRRWVSLHDATLATRPALRSYREGKDWTMVERFVALDRPEARPLTLCYLTVSRDRQSIVDVSYVVALRAHRLAGGTAGCSALAESAARSFVVRAQTRSSHRVSVQRPTSSWSGR